MSARVYDLADAIVTRGLVCATKTYPEPATVIDLAAYRRERMDEEDRLAFMAAWEAILIDGVPDEGSR